MKRENLYGLRLTQLPKLMTKSDADDKPKKQRIFKRQHEMFSNKQDHMLKRQCVQS